MIVEPIVGCTCILFVFWEKKEFSVELKALELASIHLPTENCNGSVNSTPFSRRTSYFSYSNECADWKIMSLMNE